VKFLRKDLLGLALVAVACAGEPFHSAPAASYRVLFIGNSLTAVNDLPRTVAGLATTLHDSITVDAATGPDLAIIDHVNGATNALDLIKKGRWHFVVLQQGPTSQQLGRDTLILASKILDPLVRAAGGRIAELMVWPSAQNRSTFDGALQSCKEAAQAVAGLCFPAGQAWRAAWAFDPTLPLYGPDGYHPSELGTYLAALVVYEGITGRVRRRCRNRRWSTGTR
jgi:hypothetical protein